MAQTQHTPGPWMAKRAPDGPIDIFDSRGRDVVTLYGGGVESESKEANARLIAAAPDMLEALIEAERLFEHTWAMNGTIHVKMRAAIAKAEGRSNG